MPVAAAANSFLAGIDKQTNEATVSSAADYSLPVFDSSVEVVEALNRIEVTDAASIEGDPYKGPQSWRSTLGFPAYAASLGTFLQSLWPTDTKTGAGPYTHAFSGLGGTQSWISVYQEWPNASAKEFTHGKGLASGITFSATEEGGPLRIEHRAIGQETTVAAWTVGTADTLADGYFQMQATGAKFELALATPNANPSTQPEKVRNFSLSINRDVTPLPVVDAFQVSQLGQGKVSFDLSMQWLWTDWQAYQATYFGAVAGTSASPTIVYGAAELTFKHSVTAAWEFTIYIPKVAFRVGAVNPDPTGGPIVLDVTGVIAKPSSGDHVQPTLINAVNPAY